MKPPHPPTIRSDSVPGPNYDPLDGLVENCQNVQSFISHLASHPEDLVYVNTHLTSILALRRIISHQLEKLSEEPYYYSTLHLKKLHEENEQIFIFVEGIVGALSPLNKKKLVASVKAAEQALVQFDNELTP